MALAPHTSDESALDTLYMLREPPAVHTFLQEYPFLVPFLVEAHANIQPFFPSSPVTLEVVNDPEDAGSSQLVALISTSDDPRNVFEKLQKLDSQWWLNAMDRAQGKFHVNVAFE
jgi:hypothetical protein